SERGKEKLDEIAGQQVESRRCRGAVSDVDEDRIVQFASNQAGASRWAFVETRYFGRGSEEQGVWFLGRIRYLRRRTSRCTDWRSRSVRHRSSRVCNGRSLTAQLSRRNSVRGSVLPGHRFPVHRTSMRSDV